MSEYKSKNSNLGEVLYGSVLGTGKLISKFLEGALTWPIPPLIIPTVVRSVKTQINEEKEKLSIRENKENQKNYSLNNSFQRIGGFTSAILAGLHVPEAYHFVSEHPYTLAIPVLTNLLSAGYERYRFDKEKGLEDKLK